MNKHRFDGHSTTPGHRPSAGRQQALGRADLHVHSHWSDGAQSPELVVRAAAGRVDVLAITDHDEIQGAATTRSPIPNSGSK